MVLYHGAENFFGELTGLYRNAISIKKQVTFLGRYPLREIQALLIKSRRLFARLRTAARDYPELK